MSDWAYLNKCRVTSGTYASTPEDGFNGAFKIEAAHTLLYVIASNGLGWRHVSVTQRYSDKPPTWDVMCAVKDLFFEPEQVVVQYHPAKSKYVNNHPGCLHLWQPLDQVMPVPETYLVGIKSLGVIR